MVYTKAGNTLASLASARVSGAAPRAVIDHKLYWAAVGSLDEARYLTGILNSESLLARVKPLQALGLFGGRDFDKNIFSVLIPTYNRIDPAHRRLADLAAQAEQAAAGVQVDPSWTFQRTRMAVRDELGQTGIADLIEQAVDDAVPPVDLP